MADERSNYIVETSALLCGLDKDAKNVVDTSEVRIPLTKYRHDVTKNLFKKKIAGARSISE